MFTVEKANVDDAEAILNLQKLAYESEARLYNDWSLPALTQTNESLVAEFENSLFLKATVSNVIVGSVRAKLSGNTCEIGRLIVDPQYQGQGIGSDLLRSIEAEYPKVNRFELFTGELSTRNIALYERHSYRKFATKVLSDAVTLVFMEKQPSNVAANT